MDDLPVGRLNVRRRRDQVIHSKEVNQPSGLAVALFASGALVASGAKGGKATRFPSKSIVT